MQALCVQSVEQIVRHFIGTGGNLQNVQGGLVGFKRIECG